MEITAKQFSRIESMLPRQRGNVSLENLAVINAMRFDSVKFMKSLLSVSRAYNKQLQRTVRYKVPRRERQRAAAELRR